MDISVDKGKNGTCGGPVQERLLDAAEGLFCENGLGGTTVRDIAAAAKCNIASINYYFRGKENLYAEVWRRIFVQMRDIRITSIQDVMSGSENNESLEELLRAFAYAFLGPWVDDEKAQQLMKLMAREMLDHHLQSNMFIEEMIKPTLTTMGEALAKASPGLAKEKVPLVVFSIAGQLIHIIRVKAMFEESDELGMPIFDLAGMVEHIVQFSAAGIRAYAKDETE